MAAGKELADARHRMRQIGWLSARPAAFVEPFLAQTSLRLLRRSEFAHHLGDEPGSFYGIVSGAVLVLLPVSAGSLQYGHLGLPGQWLGAAPALTNIRRQVALEAAVETLLLAVPPGAAAAMLASSPAVAREFLSLIVANQQIAIRTAADLLIQAPRARVAARLLTLSGLRLGQAAEPGPSQLPLTQDQLAAMCGLSRNSINRVLQNFESARLCERRYGSIHIPSLKAVEDRLERHPI